MDYLACQQRPDGSLAGHEGEHPGGTTELAAFALAEAGLRRAAERWLERSSDPKRNAYANGAGTPFWHCAYMWAPERWCGLTGRATVADRDRHAERAARLVDTRVIDGSWTSDDNPLESTCLTPLFQRRATISSDGELKAIYERIDRERAAAERVPERPGDGALGLTDATNGPPPATLSSRAGPPGTRRQGAARQHR